MTKSTHTLQSLGNALVRRRWRHGFGDFLVVLAAVLVAFVLQNLPLSRAAIYAIIGGLLALYLVQHLLFNRRLHMRNDSPPAKDTETDKIEAGFAKLRDRIDRTEAKIEQVADLVLGIADQIDKCDRAAEDRSAEMLAPSESPIPEPVAQSVPGEMDQAAEMLSAFDQRLMNQEKVLGQIQKKVIGRKVARPLSDLVSNVDSQMKRQSQTLRQIKEQLGRRPR